ncbi:PhoH family protein [Exilibacterium tricleocarpae]|uniref:PhoH family protein n=1 Tax=Exilibacterium tricleocarpae TaxID=2591008 RepID=A0A545TZ23_9GAMM|nr:PhoH family protein [Exilibacterium tricleocarpae]TQV82454.1 PhoH family protein [Exilibacterium tricleocarpae]
MEKIYVLDTNVLLHDPLAIKSFAEHRVVLPMTVLEELDVIKDRREKDVSREARIAIQSIDNILSDAKPWEIQEGVRMPATALHEETGTLAIYQDQRISDDDNIPYLNGTPQQANDNRIINVALKLQAAHPDDFVCLVTKDINMRLKAKGSGLEHVEDYRNDRVLDDLDLLAKGYEYTPGAFWERVEKVKTETHGRTTVHTLARETLPNAYPQMFVVDDTDFIGFVTEVDEDFVHLQDMNRASLMHQEFWGIRPRNLEQAMAFFVLQYQDSDMTVMTGPAGSGKTLLALAYGLHVIMEEKRYNKLIVARSTPPIAEDIGFLPGTEEEKMAPWLAAFEDNLEVLHGTDEHSFSSIDYVKERANIQFKSLNFMRGRSFNNAYIIIDESQGLTQFQLKSIITRVGQNSKIVVLGNLAQIDNKYITPLTSGLTYLVEKVKGFDYASIMHVNGIERSRLAEFAEDNL